MDFVTLSQQQQALQEALDESPEAGVLHLVPNLLAPGRLYRWLETLPNRTYRLGNTAISDIADDEFTVIGEAMDSLSLPQYSGTSEVSSGSVTLTFRQPTLGSEIAQAMDWDEVNWRLESQVYEGQALLSPEGFLHFSGLPQTPTPRSYSDWLSDFSAGQGNSLMSEGVPFLESLGAESIRCIWSFNTTEPTIPTLDLLPSDLGGSLSLGPFSFSNPTIGAQMMLHKPDTGPILFQGSNSVRMTIVMGEIVVDALLTISPGPAWSLRLTSRAGLTWTDVTGFLASTDFGAPLQDVADVLDDLPLSGLTLTGVYLMVNPRELSVQSVSLVGTFEYFNGTIDYTLQLPSGEFYGGLHGEKSHGQSIQYDGISIQPILSHYFGQDNIFPGATMSTLSWSIIPNTKTFSLNLGLEEVLSIYIGFTPVTIKRLALTIEKSFLEDTLEGSFTGTFTLAGVHFFTSAVYRDDVHWDFHAGADYGMISFINFVQGVADFTGATLPSNVPDTTIAELEIGFSTAHQNFALKAKTDSTVVIPFLDIEENRIYVDIDMATGIDGETGLRVLQGKM
ncbi:MAG: hypothetical protein AAFQ98_21735, partial [Bacteroidota bacterium]